MIDDDYPSSEEQRLQELKSRFSSETQTPNAEKPIIPLAALPKSTKADTAAIENIPVTENGYQFKKHPGRMKSDKIIEIPEILENTLESIFKGMKNGNFRYCYFCSKIAEMIYIFGTWS